jgi:hypothetical protein
MVYLHAFVYVNTPYKKNYEYSCLAGDELMSFETCKRRQKLTIIKEIEQNQPTWYGHVQRMAEGRLPKTALKWMPKRNRESTRKTEGKLDGRYKEGHERKKPK